MFVISSDRSKCVLFGAYQLPCLSRPFCCASRWWDSMPPDVKTPHAESLSLEAWCTSPEWAMPSKWMEVWGTFSLKMEWGWSTAWRPPPRPSAGPWYVEVSEQAESALPPVHALDKSVSRNIWGALKSLWKLCKVKTGQTFGRVWASLTPLGATWISPGMITKKLAFLF